MQDVRWMQRFDNYKRALKQLQDAIELMKERALSKLEKQGAIQAFEFTHELAWKTLKDFLEDRGNSNMYGSRDVTKKAFELGLIQDGEAWMQMIKSRNLSTHTYNEATADAIIALVKKHYYPLFEALKLELEGLEKDS
jgi:nucleotidyltransferase substrate binding protein (TIGR01987 family)